MKIIVKTTPYIQLCHHQHRAAVVAIPLLLLPPLPLLLLHSFLGACVRCPLERQAPSGIRGVCFTKERVSRLRVWLTGCHGGGGCCTTKLSLPHPPLVGQGHPCAGYATLRAGKTQLTTAAAPNQHKGRQR